MATHDYVIANASGAAVRSDLNNALAAIVSNNSNATEPATTYAYMWWVDTTNGQLKQRNAANDDWIVVRELDGTMLMEDGTVASPGLAFASDLDTGFYRPADNKLGIATGGTSRAVIDDSGRVLVGTTSAATNGNSQYALIAVKGNTLSSGSGGLISLQRGEASAGGNITSGENIGGLVFGDSDGQPYGSILCDADGTSDTGDYPGALVFSTTADGGSSPTERMRIASDGVATFEETARLALGAYFGTATNTKRIDDASNGTGTATLYIGNAAIQVSSDVRLKENIEDTQLNALDAISQINVKDFTWNDPTDTSFNNRNARGTWTGLIAQELVEVLPFVVNAPRNEEDGSIDYESEDRWTLDQSQLCPVLIKAIQQQQEIIADLEARLSTLEGAN